MKSTVYVLTTKGNKMTVEKDRGGEKREEKKEKKSETELTLISEELIRWMTEGTSKNNVPRSDCG